MSESTEHSTRDGNLDVFCILLIMTIVVGGALFWVSSQ